MITDERKAFVLLVRLNDALNYCIVKCSLLGGDAVIGFAATFRHYTFIWKQPLTIFVTIP